MFVSAPSPKNPTFLHTGVLMVPALRDLLSDSPATFLADRARKNNGIWPLVGQMCFRDFRVLMFTSYERIDCKARYKLTIMQKN